MACSEARLLAPDLPVAWAVGFALELAALAVGAFGGAAFEGAAFAFIGFAGAAFVAVGFAGA